MIDETLEKRVKTFEYYCEENSIKVVFSNKLPVSVEDTVRVNTSTIPHNDKKFLTPKIHIN